MINKNVPKEDRALEIPLTLNELENALEVLGQKIDTIEERLKTVSRPYKDQPEPPTAATTLYSTTLGIRIDRSVTSVSNAVERLRTIIDYLEV